MIEKYILLMMILGTLTSVTFISCFFPQSVYAGFDIKSLANRKAEDEYALISSSEN